MAEGKAPTRRERRREETRTRLIAAARELISEKGVAALRIQELAARADVGLGSFYNHFASKDELVEQVVTESLQDLSETLLAGIEDVSAEQLVTLSCHRIVGLAFDDPQFAQLIVHLNNGDALFSHAIRPYAKRVVDAGIASGRFPVMDEEVALTVIIGGAIAVMRAAVDGHHPRGAEAAFAESVLRMLGLPPAEARELSASPPATA